MPDMPVTPCSTLDASADVIAHDAFALVRGGAMRDILGPFGSLADWRAFSDSWNALELDTYMADGGRYRRRRHAVFAARATGRDSAAAASAALSVARLQPAARRHRAMVRAGAGRGRPAARR